MTVNIFVHRSYQFGRLTASSVDRRDLGASSDTWIQVKIRAGGILELTTLLGKACTFIPINKLVDPRVGWCAGRIKLFDICI